MVAIARIVNTVVGTRIVLSYAQVIRKQAVLRLLKEIRFVQLEEEKNVPPQANAMQGKNIEIHV